MKKIRIILLLAAAIVILFALLRGGEVRVHAHQYHPAPYNSDFVCPDEYDTCPYAPYTHKHKGYPTHRHEYQGEYE